LGERREPRIQARLQVRIAGIDASGRPLLQMVTTRNISRQGALLEGIQSKLKLGEIVAITYKSSRARFRVIWVGDAGTERAGQMLAVKGIVVNRRPGFGISVKFTEMSEEAQEQLRRFVQSHLGLRGK